MKIMNQTRTDVHRPSSPDFDPEAYECLGVFDMSPEWPNPGEVEHRRKLVEGLVDKGYRHGPGSSHQCGHCGAHIRYAALMAREDVHEYIYVGEICLTGRFEALTKAEFQRLRKQAALNRERVAKRDKIANLVDEHPLLAWLTYLDVIEDGDYLWASGFVYSIATKLNHYGELSERQIETVESALVRETERSDQRVAREAEQAALAASGVRAPEGKVVVEGEIVSTKVQEGQWGSTLKMVVKTDEGWKVWSTVPSSLPVVELRGLRVRFTATLSRSDRDPLFAFAKRPTKAEILTEEVA